MGTGSFHFGFGWLWEYAGNPDQPRVPIHAPAFSRMTLGRAISMPSLALRRRIQPLSVDEVLRHGEEQDEHGQARHCSDGHHDPLVAVGLRHEFGDIQRDRLHLLALNSEQGPEQAVPLRTESQHGQGCDGWPGIGQHYAGEYPWFAGAVYSSGVEHFIGECQQKLPHEEDAESASQEGHNEPGIAVLQAHAHDHHVQRDHDGLEGNHHRRHDSHEHRIAPLELEFCQAVSCHGR